MVLSATCISVYVQNVSVKHSAKAKYGNIYNVSMRFSLDLTADDWEWLEVPVFQTFVKVTYH